MATLSRLLIICVVGSGLGGCAKLQGFGGAPTPLVTFNIVVNGDLTPLRPANDTGERSLQIALVWGAQWLTEPFCILPSSSDTAPVIAAGCRDPFGFVPARVDASGPIIPGTPTTLSLFQLPSADLLVGDATSRMAYASLVFYDDRDRSGTLELSMPHRAPTGADDGPPEDDSSDSTDIIYGASFLTMTAPDQRVAYREGAFDEMSAFYPRSGCPDPGMAFSVLGAGGFSAAAGLASGALGTLPAEDPSQCSPMANSPPSAGQPSDPLISITAQAPAIVNEVGCAERTNDGSIRYREPPATALDLTDRVSACAPLPSFDAGGQTKLTQFVVSGTSADRCQGLTHYTLRGCREDVTCAVPDWDFTAMPPSWWPCTN